jgi:integrase
VEPDYRNRRSSLESSAFGQHLDSLSPAQFDARILSYFLCLFSQKMTAADGFKTLAMIGHFWSRHGKFGRYKLARVRRLLQGWGSLMPEISIVPPPHAAVAGLAAVMAATSREMALAVIVAHICYLRPCELFSLRARDVVRPVLKGVGSGYNHHVLLLGPYELRRPTKTGVFEDAVPIDSRESAWVGPALDRLRPQRMPDKKLWGFSQRAFNKRFALCVAELGLSHWCFTPRSLRHSGPSRDRIEKRRSLAEVQRHGRWREPRTVRRYEQASRTLALLSDMETPFLEFLQHCATHLSSFVRGDLVAHAPPMQGWAASS